MKEPVCLLTDDVFTAWCLLVGGACLLAGLATLVGEVYDRGHRDGMRAMREQLERVGTDIVRAERDGYAANLVRRVMQLTFLR